ncbi:MAG: kynureninase [Fimbriimonadales bacterium]
MLEEARALDAADPLAAFRDRFVISDPDLIYLDGNSLGRMPKSAVDVLDRLKLEWGDRLVTGWGGGWYDLPRRLGAKIAKLIGAGEDEVIVCDSTSVNLYKLVVAVDQGPTQDRLWALTDDTNFPSDLYVLQGVFGRRVTALPSGPDGYVTIESFVRAMDRLHGRGLLLALSHTAFKCAYVHPIGTLTKEARKRNLVTLWDLSHSVGVLPVDLNHAGVDLAIGCTYKYLNGGPGAPAFLFVRRDLQEKLGNPIRGWFGQRDPFRFSTDYHPAAGINRFLAGTPPILSMAAAEPGIDLVIEAGVDEIRRKSVAQTEFLIRLFDRHLEPLGFQLASPRDSAVRGSHVSISHRLALQIDQALIHDMKVVPDFRTPDNLRLGIAPLYTRFVDLHEAVMRLEQVMERKLYEHYPAAGIEVT